MLVDTHSHLNFHTFKDDADQVIQNTLDEDTWMVVVGSDYKSSQAALKIANRYERGVYAAIGLHPIHLFPIRAQGDDYDFDTKAEEFSYDNYEKLAKFEKVVAIGEIGLDYYHIDPSLDAVEVKRKQQDVFAKQLLLSRKVGKPAIIHCRQAHDDTLELIRGLKRENKDLFSASQPWGVMHCFSGDENLAWEYFGLGLLISFTGLITFSKQWDDLIRKLPDDKFMLETDCPFMTPEPFRGKRNEPIYVKYVAERIAEIKNWEPAKVAEVTTRNAKNLFKF